MSKVYIHICIIFVILVSFLSCSSPTPQQALQETFQEDIYIITALRSEELHDPKTASHLYTKLFDLTGKEEYRYKALINTIEYELYTKKYLQALQRIQQIEATKKLEDKLVRFKIVALAGIGKMRKAEQLALELVKKTQYVDDYILVSSIYVEEKKFDKALQYLESGYIKEYDEKLLDKMVIILYVNLHRKKDAIAQLETHIRIRGCSELLCKRLVGFYSDENNVDGLLTTYKKMYEERYDKQIAKKIIQLYGYTQEYDKLLKFLELTHSDDIVLLDLYRMKKDYVKAYRLSYKLYENTGDIEHLGHGAIFEYEAHSDDKKVIYGVIDKLKKVVKQKKSPLFLNFLGYIMIDHEIDIVQGMEFVQKALDIKPESVYYLDSLAWGYYKLHQCQKAKEIMDRLEQRQDGKIPEVLEHIKQIDKCLTTSTKGK